MQNARCATFWPAMTLPPWQRLWIFAMAGSLLLGGVWMWANLPPDPAPLVVADNWIYVHELQREATEARIRAQQDAAALTARAVGEELRRRFVLNALTLWAGAGALAYGIGWRASRIRACSTT